MTCEQFQVKACTVFICDAAPHERDEMFRHYATCQKCRELLEPYIRPESAAYQFGQAFALQERKRLQAESN